MNIQQSIRCWESRLTQGTLLVFKKTGTDLGKRGYVAERNLQVDFALRDRQQPMRLALERATGRPVVE